MEYWKGQMNWKLDSTWQCSTCKQNKGLEWGFIHAQCRCNSCHTEYSMRRDDEQRSVLTTPRCMLKKDYKEPLRQAYAKYQMPIDEMTDAMIDEFYVGECASLPAVL